MDRDNDRGNETAADVGEGETGSQGVNGGQGINVGQGMNDGNDGQQQQTAGAGQEASGTQQLTTGEPRKKVQPVDPRIHAGPFVKVDDKYYRAEDMDAVHQQMEEEHQEYLRGRYENWLQSPPGLLCAEFYKKFHEFKRYMETHPQEWKGYWGEFKEHQLFTEGLRIMGDQQRERAERDRKNLLRAQTAARCEHLHADGERCGSPRVKGKKLCYMHERMEQAKALKVDLGPMEDAESIQLGIKKLQQAVIEEMLNDKQIRQLTNLIQIATWNVTRMKFANR